MCNDNAVAYTPLRRLAGNLARPSAPLKAFTTEEGDRSGGGGERKENYAMHAIAATCCLALLAALWRRHDAAPGMANMATLVWRSDGAGIHLTAGYRWLRMNASTVLTA